MSDTIGTLAIEISNSPDRPEDMAKLDLAGARLVSSGEDVLLLNNMFRRLYPAYFEKDDFREDKSTSGNSSEQYTVQMKNREYPVALTIRDIGNYKWRFDPDAVFLQAQPRTLGEQRPRYYPCMEGHLVTKLLDTLLEHKSSFCRRNSGRGPKFTPIIDDRMLVYTYVAFPGFLASFTSESVQKVFFSMLLYVDNPERDYTFRYQAAFTNRLLDAHVNQRWLHYGTWSGYTRYSAARQLFGHAPYLYRPFVSMYYQMYLLAIFYRARLIQFSGNVATLAKKLSAILRVQPGRLISPELKKEFRDLHSQFMEFMNRHWFVEVTPQEQGIEEYQLMRRAFEVEPMYRQVKDEIERADELVELFHNERVERFNFRVGWVGFLIGCLAVLTGYFGMNFTQITDGLPLSWLAVTSAAVAAVAVVIAFVLILSFRRSGWRKYMHWAWVLAVALVVAYFVYHVSKTVFGPDQPGCTLIDTIQMMAVRLLRG